MVSAQFRAAVSTVPGLFAIVLVTVSAVLVVLNPSVTLVVGFWILLVGLVGRVSTLSIGGGC
jgi:hypothetical protein